MRSRLDAEGALRSICTARASAVPQLAGAALLASALAAPVWLMVGWCMALVAGVAERKIAQGLLCLHPRYALRSVSFHFLFRLRGLGLQAEQIMHPG